MKNIFAHHGIPELLITDNAGQFVSSEFKTFAQHYGFLHETSSPHNPQSNGEAERAVREAKKILAQDDPMLGLLVHRSTPSTTTGVSPAELAMGRRLRTRLPTLGDNLEPKVPIKSKVQSKDREKKKCNEHFFNKRNSVKSLPILNPGDTVLQKVHGKQWESPSTVIERVGPRSYIIETESGARFRRNRRYLRPTKSFKPAAPDCDLPTDDQPVPQPLPQQPVQPQPIPPQPSLTTRSGRAVNPPAWFKDYVFR